MTHAVTIPLGVVVARERIDHPWQEFRWRPLSVFLDPPPIPIWQELRRDPKLVQYFGGVLPLELHRKETEGYLANLVSQTPSVYVVLREDPFASCDTPVQVHLVSASPYEVQAYGESGVEIVDSVPMPEPLTAIVRAFVEQHHKEEPFIKRQRQRVAVDEEAPHQFGQEPIVVLRERMRAKKGNRE